MGNTFASSSLTKAINISAIFSADMLRPTSSDLAAAMISSLVRKPLLSLSNFLKARRSRICLKRQHYKFNNKSRYEPPHDKPTICAPSEDSDQPKDPSFLHADSEDSDQTADAQADLSLRWAHSHFVCFVMRWLMYSETLKTQYFTSMFDAEFQEGIGFSLGNFKQKQ